MAGILTERLMNHRPLLLPLALLVPLALAACNKPAEPATDPAASSMAAAVRRRPGSCLPFMPGIWPFARPAARPSRRGSAA